MMTRKDYRVIAYAIREALDGKFAPTPTDVAEAIAAALYANSGLDSNGNRRFDRERFLAEAGVR